MTIKQLLEAEDSGEGQLSIDNYLVGKVRFVLFTQFRRTLFLSKICRNLCTSAISLMHFNRNSCPVALRFIIFGQLELELRCNDGRVKFFKFFLVVFNSLN